MNETTNNTETLVVEENKASSITPSKTCPRCNTLITAGQKFCPNCGITVEEAAPTPKTCSRCNAAVTPGQKFCPNCGNTIAPPPVQKIVCKTCGSTVSSDSSSCPVCGVSIYNETASHTASSTPVAVSATPQQNSYTDNTNSKKKFFIIGAAVAALAIIAILFFVFRKIPVDDIVLSVTTVELKVGESQSVSCTVYPDNASDKKVTWTTSDSSVATVSAYGKITAIKKGTCTITAKVGEESKTISVTVKPKVDLEKMYNDNCSSTWATLGSDKSYLSVDTNPYNYEGGDYRYFSVVDDAIKKINKSLGLPDSLYESMNTTSWSMGKQSETFENIGVVVTWTYHPDKGLEVTYKLINN